MGRDIWTRVPAALMVALMVVAGLAAAPLGLAACRPEVAAGSAVLQDIPEEERMEASSDERGPVYFGGWGSYQIPRKPQEPLSREQAIQRLTYYEAYYDASNRLVRFEKFLDGNLDWADRYEYWDNGKIKAHHLRRSDGTETVHSYDQQGNKVSR